MFDIIVIIASSYHFFPGICTFIGAISAVCFPRATADVNVEPMGELKTMPSQAIFHNTYYMYIPKLNLPPPLSRQMAWYSNQ